METGKNIYAQLKRNNITVIALSAITGITIIITALIIGYVYKESQKNLYAINDRGILIPLSKLQDKADEQKQIKGNLDYFVSLYYDLDGYTMKEKKEKLYWLLGTQPTAIMKDRDRKGYFNNFLSITGLKQHAQIDQNSWKLGSIDYPVTVDFIVNIQVINGEIVNNYKTNIHLEIDKTNKNYPYNPYGYIITNFSEQLTKVESTDKYNVQKDQQALNNQNN